MIPAWVDPLDDQGWVVLPGLLEPARCAAVAASWHGDPAAFRSRVVMARHGFGRGEYRYWDSPLPAIVQALRRDLYPSLAAVANRWQARLADPDRFPDTLEPWLAACHAAGQSRPTPLLLRYAAGDFNCLHQDVYGERFFPLQATVLLSRPGEDFDGGEFVLTDQRPRRQSIAAVVPLQQGDAVVFAGRQRPVRGERGWYRANHRHGVSRVRHGERFSLGLIFHDAA